jgi:hypothetical protein
VALAILGLFFVARSRIAKILALEREQYDALLLSSVVNTRRRKLRARTAAVEREARVPARPLPPLSAHPR